MANASHKGMGSKNGHQHVGETSPEAFDQDDMASEMKGRNSLQGNDQRNVRNQREAVPDVKRETEGVVESFEKTEEHLRSRRSTQTQIDTD